MEPTTPQRYGPFAAVLFDMDGVVVDTVPSIAIFWHQIARRYGIRISEEEMALYVHGRPARETLDALFAWLEEDERQEVYRLMRTHELADAYVEIPGALDLLRSLGQLRIPTALVTGGDAIRVHVVERHLDLTDLFTARVTADDVTAGKPHPQAYLLAAERLGVDPAACLVFEDAPSGVRSAIAAGTACIGIGSGSAADVLRIEGATAVVPDLIEVSVSRAGGRKRVFIDIPADEAGSMAEEIGA